MKIAINPELCFKKRFVMAKCTACRDVCPEKCINDKLEISGACINCGLCLAKCPVEAIAGDDYTLGAVRQLVDKGESVQLVCQKCQPGSSWPCLGFLDPTLLLAFVFSGWNSKREVLIYHKECAACNDAVARHLAWTIAEANRLLGEGNKLIINTENKVKASAPGVGSRRQFLAQLWGASISTVRAIALPDSETMQPIARRNLFIAHGGAKLLTNLNCNQTTFKTLIIGESCNACGLCSKTCRTGAITTAAREEMLEIRHNPALCRDCRVCVSQCPEKAIELRPASSLREETVGVVKIPVCQECGRPYQPFGNSHVCIDCMHKTKVFS